MLSRHAARRDELQQQPRPRPHLPARQPRPRHHAPLPRHVARTDAAPARDGARVRRPEGAVPPAARERGRARRGRASSCPWRRTRRRSSSTSRLAGSARGTDPGPGRTPRPRAAAVASSSRHAIRSACSAPGPCCTATIRRSPGRSRRSAAGRRPASRPTPAARRTGRKARRISPGCARTSPGDPLRRIAWKAYARGQGLHTKQYAGTDVVSHVFDWDSLRGLDTEARLAQLCRWVLDAQERGEALACACRASRSRRTSAGPAIASLPRRRSRSSTAVADFDASSGRRPGPRSRWVLAALAVAVAAHFRDAHARLGRAATRRRDGLALPPADRLGWPLPPRWLRLLAVLVAAVGWSSRTYRTINGIEAGTALLVLMAAVKLLETRSPRDLTVLVFIAVLPAVRGAAARPAAAAAALAAGGDAAHDRARCCACTPAPRATPGARSAPRPRRCCCRPLPLALALFLLFPTLPGPVLGPRRPESARTGSTDEMTPGDVSDLSASGEPPSARASSVRHPPPVQRYWRGPVLHEFDGRRWRRPRGQAFPGAERRPSHGAALRLPDHARAARPQLDPCARPAGASGPSSEAYRAYDFTLLVPASAQRRDGISPAVRTRAYRAGHGAAGVAAPQGPALPRDRATRARSRSAGNWPRATASPDGMIARDAADVPRTSRSCTRCSRRALGDDSVDEFLFSTRKGFCEHYASAFTLVMRAAGVPARVVTGYQGGEFNPLRRLPARAPVRRACLVGDLARRPRLGARRPDRGGRAGAHRARPAERGAAQTSLRRDACAKERELWLQVALTWDT